jgi:hypothetical protein
MIWSVINMLQRVELLLYSDLEAGNETKFAATQQIFNKHYDPWIDSASNRNDY